MFFLDVAIVNRRGAKASRFRTLCRSLFCLAPLLGALPLILVVVKGDFGDDAMGLAPLAYVYVLAVVSLRWPSTSSAPPGPYGRPSAAGRTGWPDVAGAGVANLK